MVVVNIFDTARALSFMQRVPKMKQIEKGEL